MRTLKPTKRYKRAFEKCKSRHYKLDLLYQILDILVSRDFTPEERRFYKVYQLHDNTRYRGCNELHIGGRNSDWLLIYHIEGNSIKFDDMIIELEDTGTHSDCFGAYEPDNMEIIWV